MARDPIPSWYFVLVVVRLGHRFLLVHERKHGQLWYLPAGRVELGEDFITAAKRETLEETGVPVEIEGILRFEHSPHPFGTRVRVILLARPIDDTPPKEIPDKDTLGARWFTLEELKKQNLRGPEVIKIFEHVNKGPMIAPLSLLTEEGAPFNT